MRVDVKNWITKNKIESPNKTKYILLDSKQASKQSKTLCIYSIGCECDFSLTNHIFSFSL